MKLMTRTLEKRFARVGRQENQKDPLIITKFFNPAGAGTWYATEYDPKTKIFFGYVSICGDLCEEWGYFSLKELEEYTSPYDTGIERDLYFKECLASKVAGGK